MVINKNKKLLVLVESPNKTKSVTSILKSLGYTNVKVLATVGHTTQIKNVRGSYKNTGIYPDKNFKVTYEVMEDKHKVVENIKAQAKWADLVLIASDPDREGENLGNHIKDLLKLKEDQYYRITYHSITKDAIKHAMENPTKMDKHLCNAAEARQIVDKMIGYSLSPIAKTYVGAKSVGRCQSIGLKLIVDREKEIQNFIPEKYIDLYLNFIKGNTTFKAKYTGTETTKIDHLRTQAEVTKIKSECNSNYIISDIQKREKQESPKPPFCTATYQQEAASKLGLKVKDAMSCAQKLFEGLEVNGEHVGLITYMRSDSEEFAADFIPELQKYIENTYGKNVYTAPRKGKKSETAQEGHEALRVVSLEMTPEKLSGFITNELLIKVYRLIWQRTLASAMPNAIISETLYTINNNGHQFILKSDELIKPGYRQIYSYLDDDDTSEELIKETFSIGEKLENTSLEAQEKATQPKPRYKEASLIKELQKREIGRPSTYATIVETVLSPTRGYCELEDKVIVPTEKGIQLANFLDRAFSGIINYDYTKNMEQELDTIANGKLKELDFLNEFYSNLENAIKNNTETAQSDNKENPTCPKCGSPMILRRSRFGKLFYGCSKYPKCNGIVNIN